MEKKKERRYFMPVKTRVRSRGLRGGEIVGKDKGLVPIGGFGSEVEYVASKNGNGKSVEDFYHGLVETDVANRARMDLLEADGKPRLWVKEKIFQYRKLWWARWLEAMESGDKDVRKNALIEYNKLQVRLVPTNDDSGGVGGIVVKINQFNNNTTKIEEKVIDIGDGKPSPQVVDVK